MTVAKTRLSISTILIILIFGIIFGITLDVQFANAQFEPPKNPDVICAFLKAGSPPLTFPKPLNPGDTIGMGDKVACEANIMGNTKVTDIEIEVRNPMGEKIVAINDQQFGLGQNPPEEKKTFDFVVNKRGTWMILLNFTGSGNMPPIKIVREINSSFFVVPESPIGTLAMIGSSLGAFGAYVRMRRYRTKI